MVIIRTSCECCGWTDHHHDSCISYRIKLLTKITQRKKIQLNDVHGDIPKTTVMECNRSLPAVYFKKNNKPKKSTPVVSAFIETTYDYQEYNNI